MGDRLHWRVPGSTSSQTTVGSRRRVFRVLWNLECPVGLSRNMSTIRDRSDDSSHHERTLCSYHGATSRSSNLSFADFVDHFKQLSDDLGSFHNAILATVDLSYLRLILRLPALIFISVPRNNFKTIVKPAHVKNKIVVFHLKG